MTCQLTCIGFTGHRNTVTDEATLDAIAARFPGAVWVHGDCPDGFDAQVRRYAEAHGIQEMRLPGRPGTYLIRNREIVERVRQGNGILFACYDGRYKGGTAYTVTRALREEVTVTYVPITRLKG
jgi:hypothetical protein